MIVAVLPAYNEASCIGALLTSFCEAIEEEGKPCRIIVVNDGSSDATAEVVSRFKGRIDLDLVNHEKNRGLAEAIKTGLFRAVETSEERDIIVTMDADNSHLPGLLFRMVRLVREGNDVVIASRYQKGAKIRGLSLYRKTLSIGAALLFRLVMPISGVRDYTCGYRAYRAGLLKNAFREYGDEFISEQGFSCMVDILLKLRKYDPIMEEVPLILRYDQKKSASKMHVGKTVRQTLQLLFKRRLGL
ncbi:glycosyltransferase family 2 protein [Geotalea sp. SG265]|uniref:glycosyltransferase family 2 protein n=1 Tax=Geotalea sp. SG265 TaxID=2922867 RepID=UPI001FAFC857|nr:glycosyltransferase family 2 protein [Geotalea sp. SG265]